MAYIDKFKTVSSTGAYRSPLTKYSKTDLDTSDGLFQLAQQTGLGQKAQKIIAQKGEQTKQIFSGGFISDIFDVLNSFQYGIVGLMKGNGFAEGVKTRQSFSDQDALGDNGLPGVIGGIALDIAVDPLTYIAPWTVFKKIPGAIKAGQAITKVAKASKAGQWFGEKFIYMFGKDPVYRNLYEKSVKNIATGTQNIGEIAKGISNLTPETAQKLLTKDITGRFKRVKLEELKNVLSPEEYEKVSVAWNKIDDLGKQAVDAKLLSKEKLEENFGEYIKNAYTEYEQKKGLGAFGFLKKKVVGIKPRITELTPEKMAELGQIENPAYLLFKSTFDLIKDVENTKFLNAVAKRFASVEAKEGFKQLPITQRLFTTATGEKIEILSKIKQLNKDLKPVFRQLENTFKTDKQMLSLIRNTESEWGRLATTQRDEFFKFFQAGQKITKEIPQKGIKLGRPLVEKLPEDLFDIAQQIKKREVYDTFKLAKLFEEGVLERNGFRSIKEFIDYVKMPAGVIPEKVVETIAKGNIPRIIKLQKQIEQLARKSEGLREIDKLSINDSFRFLEDTISKMTKEKEEFIEQLGKAKLSELSGKFVPENIYNDLTELLKPRDITLGNKIVGVFKYAKVVLNPATHVRNVLSNKILNWWKLGMNPLDPRVIKTDAIAIKEIFSKGGKWIDEAKTVGYDLNTFAANELKDILLAPESQSALGKNFMSIGTKLANIYQGEENYAKLSAFIFNRQFKNMGIEDAWKMAESATFNYSQVTPFVRKMRTSLWGYPFITFSLKVAPIAVETAVKYPRRISALGKIKNAIENMADIKETEAERASEPQWIKDGFYIKLPMKDKYGRSSYFDLTYIIPFGDLVSGQLVERGVKKETGMPKSWIEVAIEKLPFINFIKEISRNEDFYGDRIWNESDDSTKQLGDLFRHLTKTMSPPTIASALPGGYTSTGERREKGIIAAVRTPDEIKFLKMV